MEHVDNPSNHRIASTYECGIVRDSPDGKNLGREINQRKQENGERPHQCFQVPGIVIIQFKVNKDLQCNQSTQATKLFESAFFVGEN